eukprot:13898730-Ditylum_brightwellii.AAC.1
MPMKGKQTKPPPLKTVNFSIDEDDWISVSDKEEEDKKDHPSSYLETRPQLSLQESSNHHHDESY